MLISTAYILISVMLFALSYFFIVYSPHTKQPFENKSILILSILYFFYAPLVYIIVAFLSIPLNTGMLLFMFLNFLTVLLCLISIIINLVKIKKASKRKIVQQQDSRTLFLTVGAALLPPFLLVTSVLRGYIILNSADAIVVYKYVVGLETHQISYTINDHACYKIDLGMDFPKDLYSEHYIQHPIEEARSLALLPNIDVNLSDRFRVSLNGRTICSIPVNSSESYAQFGEAYIVKRN